MRSDELLLGDILGSIAKIIRYTGEGRAHFLSDDKTQSAVYREFEIIGEAAKHVSKDLKSKNSQVPWDSMARTRDRLIHIYFVVDEKTIWRVVENALGTWQKEVALVLRDLEGK